MNDAVEMFKLALHNEVKASVFYQKASEMTQDDNSRMVFLNFVEMEDDHARALILQTKEMAWDPAFDPAAYLAGVEEETKNLLSPDEQWAIEHGNMSEVLNLAIQSESRAKEVYLGLAASASNAEIKRYCLRLADEEESHKRSLEQLLRSLEMEPEDRPGL